MICIDAYQVLTGHGLSITHTIIDQHKGKIQVDSKEGKTFAGIGRAPLNPESIRWYYENGIPAGGGMKDAPVPGIVSLSFAVLKEYGTMSFEDVVAPALSLLDEHLQDWHDELAVTLRKLVETEQLTQGSREEKLQAARDRFYKGDIADDLVSFYIQEGGFLRKSDLAAYETLIEDPVMTNYRDYVVYKCGTWTQGPYLCQTLRLLENFNMRNMGYLSANYIHASVEALKLGFADRDEYYGDPLFADVPMNELLSDEYTAIRFPLINMNQVSKEARPGDPIQMKAVKGEGEWKPGIGGTTTCCVADRWGNLVAATPSGNRPYSFDPKTGIHHGNRLRSLNTTEGHPNRIEPGKRPRITLTPTMVLKDGKPVLAISVAGGDLQDQTTLNLLLDFVDYNKLPEAAVTLPRFSTGHHQDSFNPNPNREESYEALGSLQITNGVDQSVIDELKKRGHAVSTTNGPIGHPVMIHIDQESGMIYAAGDPKARRHAAALPGPASVFRWDYLSTDRP